MGKIMYKGNPFSGTFDNATNVAYDNSDSGLSASNIQSVIDEIWGSVCLRIYPINSIYMSADPTNPGTLFGGTWVEWGSGRVPVGVDTSDYLFETVEQIGGERFHALAIDEVPSHRHTVPETSFKTDDAGGHTHGLNNHTHSVGAHSHGLNNHTHSIPALSGTAASAGAHSHRLSATKDAASGTAKNRVIPGFEAANVANGNGMENSGAHTHSVTTNASTTGAASGSTANSSAFNTGGSSANTTSSGSHGHTVVLPYTETEYSGGSTSHNNLQPYITCYMWKRTA